MIFAKNPLHKSVKGAFCILLGVLSAMSFAVSPEGYVGMSDAPASATSYLWSALAACFAWAYHQVFVKKGERLHGLSAVFALIFGAANAFGGHLFAYDSWSMSRLQLAMLMLKALGQSIPMAAFFTWLHALLRDGCFTRPSSLDALSPRGKGWEWISRHEVLSAMLVMILCWSPYLIAFYPGTVCWDLGEMVAQFFGQTEMDTWHPVFTTWVMGSCVWLGRLVGSDNLGAALFTLLQTVGLSYALSRALQSMRHWGLNRLFRLCALAFFAILPIWGGYAQFISKDTLYTAALLLFSLNGLDALRGHCTRRTALELFGWGLLSCLLRSNGLYVVAPTALAVMALCRLRRLLAPALAGSVVCALLFSNVLIPALGIRDETASGI